MGFHLANIFSKENHDVVMIESEMTDASSDLQWAAAIPTFAEILKQSPYAKPNALPTIEEIVTSNAGDDTDRLEFIEPND